MTGRAAAQMSGPVPSPSMTGMMGLSGTTHRPFSMVIFWPSGGVSLVNFATTAPPSSFAAFPASWRAQAACWRRPGRGTGPGTPAHSEYRHLAGCGGLAASGQARADDHKMNTVEDGL